MTVLALGYLLKLFLCCALIKQSCGMFSKKQLPIDLQTCSPSKRLRHNLVDLFLSNDVSGERADSLLRDAVAADSKHVSDLVSNQDSKKHKGNAHRDLLRRLQKTTIGWPPLFLASIRTWDPKKQRVVITKLPMYLPHELLGSLLLVNSANALLQTDGLNPCVAEHVQKAERCSGCRYMPFGIWGDGVPCNWDRTQSLECFSLSLPGLQGTGANIRFPLAVINKKHCIKHDTFDDIMSVLVWSFQICALGVYPSVDHQGNALQDKKRLKLVGKDIGLRAILAEVRGDWKFYKDTFRLPAWNEKKGCCWKCSCTPDQIRDPSSTADWRTNRMTQWSFIRRLQESVHGVSPILAAPHFHPDIFQIDWLHTADLGITANFLGNLFWVALNKYPGSNRKEQCNGLFADMNRYYKKNRVTSRLDNLYPTMLKQDNKQPKLRGKAAECRFLVPFARLLVEKHFSDLDPYEKTIKSATIALNRCYDCLSAPNFSAPVLARSSKEFALLSCALEAHMDNKLWRVKPKLHLFQEMCECSNSRPSTCWTYRDEDFGGSMASTSRRRGGKASPSSMATAVLTKFAVKNPMPMLAT